jgi:RecB family endonuclease NucS
MNDRVALQKTNEGWAFINEWQLEDFVWNNLQEIFGFHPLARQHSIRGEICDILAISNDNQLVIIELKNVEDRYVTNQLTRYYDNLIEEKPFQDKINYDLGILLFAICPTFHRHNLIDQRHSRLRFSLFLFSVINENDEFYFHLSQPDESSTTKATKINFTEVKRNNQINENIPEYPPLLQKWTSGLTLKEFTCIGQIRDKILGFDQRIEELVFGKSKFRYCAEFRFDQRAKKILFFLWLPIPKRKSKTLIRMQVDTLYEYAAYWRYIPLKEGQLSCKKMDSVTIRPHNYYFIESNSFLNGPSASFYRIMTVSNLLNMIEPDNTGNIINEALQAWLARVSR